MFEARMAQATVLKKVLEAVKDMVNEANFDCSEEGICLQAMDVAHVSLVNVLLRGQGFEMFRCDRNLALGIHLASLSKVLNCAGKDDAVTVKAEDEGADTAEFMFESAKGDRITTFELTLMDIDSEHLGVPEDTTYTAVIKMPSTEFRRIISDLSTIGDTVTIEVSKDGASFQVAGDIGKGNLCIQSNTSADKPSERVEITMEEPTKQTYAMRYLTFFTKAAPLSDTVTISLSPDVPLVVEFNIGEEVGFVKYYLAPKITEGDLE